MRQTAGFQYVDLLLDLGDLSRVEQYLGNGDQSCWGRLHLLRSQYAQAKDRYARALQSAATNVDDLFIAQTGLGASCEGLGEVVEAMEHYQKAVELIEEIRSGLNPTQRETFFDVRIEGFYRTAPYEGLARVLMRLNKPEAALKTSEFTKARVFAESISRRDGTGTAGLPADILKTDRSINDRLGAAKKARQTALRENKPEDATVLDFK